MGRPQVICRQLIADLEVSLAVDKIDSCCEKTEEDMDPNQARTFEGEAADEAVADLDDAFASIDPVERQLWSARKDLLDMSLRNKMLSYRESRATSLRILNRSSASVWTSLYEQGTSVPFLAAPSKQVNDAVAELADDEDQGSTGGDLEGSFETSPGEDVTDGRALVTALESEALFRRLLRINSTAHTLIEEQGVNSLFLALGFLVWYESDSSEIERRAPLVLVPVRLVRTRRGESFSLEYDGNDVTENLSLREKLRQEFGIDLPDFPFEDESAAPSNLEDYYSEVTRSIGVQPGWSVDVDSASLGFFSFSRFLMYKDLDPKAWPEDESPTLHPVLRKLLSPGGGFANDPSSDIDFDHLDEAAEVTTSGFVMDADGSQTKAVIEVAAGANLVIQGPPGTGKSQTITNVIGSALSRGESVLFVSEKLAALNVVKRNLDKAGIGSAALELHSSRATKANVIADIETTLARARFGASNTPAPTSAAELAQARARLNAYEAVVNEQQGPTQSTFVAALGYLLKLDAKVGTDYELDDGSLLEMSEADFTSALVSLAEADQAISALGDPAQSVFRGTSLDATPVFYEDVLPTQAGKALELLTALEAQASSLAELLRVEWDGLWATLPGLTATAELLASRPNLSGIEFQGQLWATTPDGFRESLRSGLERAELRERRADQLHELAWTSSEVLSHLQNLRDGQRGWLSRLSRRYQGSRRWAQSFYRVAPPKDASTLVALAEDLSRAQEHDEVLRRNEAHLRVAFRDHVPSSVSEWQHAVTVSEYLFAFHRASNDGTLIPDAISCLALQPDASRLRHGASQLTSAEGEASTAIATLWSDLGLAHATQAERPPVVSQSARVIERITTDLPQLLYATRLTKAGSKLAHLGVTRYADLLWAWERKPYTVVDVFLRAYYRALTSRTFERNWGLLADLDSDAHDRLAERFRELDRNSWQQETRQELANGLRESLPALTGVGEMRVIAREIAKKKRHLPIRKLLEQAGPAIQRIKPVFMMSPLSIAQFLPRGSIHFDLVVFDEASQVRVADALGAIVRGTQVVVVGDTKQMPPTSFFTKMVESDDANSETADIESVLSMFQLSGAREASLQWHYRSKDPTLISVSNQEFYNRSLILFPSTQHGDDKGMGLHLHHDPSAIYDRGRTRTNPQEAEAVAAAVIAHARSNPQKSLLVVALSLSQREAIEIAVEKQRRLNPDVESFFATWRSESSIKNLESVQGDESDMVIISIGYGRWAPGGKVAHEFGPINRDGGEKRLNVLITRARERIDVFSNFRGSDLEGSSSTSKGVTVLKRFLTYAETGELETFGETGRGTDSPFEDEVLSAIEAMGYQVEPQVGEAGYFIDLAVRHPEKPGKYVLAIECDGAAYHSSVWARDRDRLRQEVLEGLGWKFHRVWSTDWFRDRTRKREIEKIRSAIDSAVATGAAKESLAGLHEAPEESAVEIATVLEDAPAAILSAENAPSFVSSPYETKALASHLGYPELHTVDLNTLLRLMLDVLDVESPVHFDQLVNRFKDAWGMGRAGDRSRSHLDRVTQAGNRGGQLVVDGDFIYRDSIRAAAPRDRSALPPAERKIDYVAPEELDEAIKQVVRDGVSVNEDEICLHVARVLGFARTTQDMKNAISRRIASLRVSSMLQKFGDRYSLSKN